MIEFILGFSIVVVPMVVMITIDDYEHWKANQKSMFDRSVTFRDYVRGLFTP